MGIDFYATAAIGCKVPIEKAKQKARVRACSHPGVDSLRYCPICGREVWVEVEVWVIPETEIGDPIVPEGLEAIFSTDREELVIAAVFVGSESHRGRQSCVLAKLEYPFVDDYRDKVQEFLEPLGLWDPDLFGLWVIPILSY